MRELFVNGLKADLDENSAIGITFQSGDVSEPCQNKLSITNSFSLPFTANNHRVFSFASNPMASDSLPYDKLIVDYYDGMIPLISNSLAFLNQTNEKYNLSVVKGSDVIETMKYNTLRDWIGRDIIDDNLVGASGFIGDIFYADPNGQLSVYDDLIATFGPTSPEIEFIKPISAKIDALTGFYTWAFGVKISSIFEWIETYGMRSQTTNLKYKVTFDGTTAQNTSFATLVIPHVDIRVEEKPAYSGNWGCTLETTGAGVYALNWMGNKTIFDLLKSICILFNAVLDINEKTNEIKIITFNKILESTTILDWSKKLVSGKVHTKKFSIGTWQQSNYINYKYDDGVNSNGGKIQVVCSNKNLEFVKNYENGVFIPRAIDVSSDIFYLLGTSDTATNPLFTQKGITELMIFSIQGLTVDNYPLTQIYQVLPLNFSANYDGMRTILTDPVSFETELYLNQLDIYNFTLKSLVKIDALGGIFYVNKINGYNSKAISGTKCELIKIR